jgi:hypothetical protein
MLCVFACLIYLSIDNETPPTIEVKVNPDKETSLIWAPSGMARYSVYLCYAADALPSEVSGRFLNWKNPPQTNWQALLTISTNQITLISKKSLTLQPAMQVGHRFYFRVGECDLKGRDRVEISLNPNEPGPFPGTIPSLVVRPNQLDDGSRFSRTLVSRLAKGFGISLAAALLLDCYFFRTGRSKAR